MRYGLKERLLGAALLIALAVIFIPFLFDPVSSPTPPIAKLPSPPKPPALEVKVEAATPPQLPASLSPKQQQAVAKANQTAAANQPVFKAEGGVEAFAVQIASFKDTSFAKRLLARQTTQGKPAYWRKINGMAVVFLGPYLTRQQAEEEQARLLKEEGAKTLVTKYVPEYQALQEGTLPTLND